MRVLCYRGGASQPAETRPVCAGVGDPDSLVWICWECLMDIGFSGQGELAQAIVQPCRIVRLEGLTIAGEFEFAVDDVVSPHAG